MGGVVSSIANGLLGDKGQSGTDEAGFSLSHFQNLLRGRTSRLNEQITATDDKAKQFGLQLADQAIGGAPSITQAFLKQANDRNLAQQISAAKANKAVNPALAARSTQRLGGQLAQQTAQAAAPMALQERMQQQQQFGNFLNQQNNNLATLTGAGTGTSTAAANTGLAQGAAETSRNMGIINGIASGGAMAFSDKNLKKNIKSEAKPKKMAKGGIYVSSERILDHTDKSNEDEKSASDAGSAIGKLFKKAPEANPLMAGGTMESATDLGKEMPMLANQGAMVPGQAPVPGDSEKNDIVNAKLSPGEMVIKRSVVEQGPEAIKSFAEALLAKQPKKYSKGGIAESDFSPREFLNKIKPYSYEYKDSTLPGTSEGRTLGIMAQDLEKAGPVGQSMVKETPNGKVVDYGRGFSGILAAQADLNQRLNEIETKYKRKK
jgi:hypothetical protein